MICLCEKIKDRFIFYFSAGGVWLPDPESSQSRLPYSIGADVWGFYAGVVLEAPVESVGHLHPVPLARSRYCSAKDNCGYPIVLHLWHNQ